MPSRNRVIHNSKKIENKKEEFQFLEIELSKQYYLKKLNPSNTSK